MLTVSDTAITVLREYLKERKITSPLRITTMECDCAGPLLKLQTGIQHADDHIADCGGVRFLIAPKLATQCGPVRVDYHEHYSRGCCRKCSGFSVSGEKCFISSYICFTQNPSSIQ